MDKVKHSDGRTCGYSESLVNNQLVVKKFYQHLDNTHKDSIIDEASMYDHMPSIDFKITQKLINGRDQPEREHDFERW